MSSSNQQQQCLKTKSTKVIYNYSQHLLSLNKFTHDLTDITDIILFISLRYVFFIMSSKHSYTHYNFIFVCSSKAEMYIRLNFQS